MKKWLICILAVIAVFMLVSFVLADEGSAGKPTGRKACITKTPAGQCAVGPKCNEYIFDATASYDPNNDKLTYLWDFGDGATSTEPVVNHTYAKAGKYTVTLTVKNKSGLPCDTATTSEVVTINTPPKPAFTAAESVCVGDTVNFDASATVSNAPEKITYTWDFGDGTKGEGVTTSHIYKTGGAHKAMLTVNDNVGSPCSIASAEKIVLVNASPVANAGCDADLCFAPNQEMGVTLNAGASSDPDGDKLSYAWDFGDGETGQGQVVTHIYKKAGAYTAKVVVDDGRGTPCSSASATVKIKLNKKPVAVAGKDVSVCLGSAVEFDGSASQAPEGSSLSYAWDYGDGAKGEGVRVSHAYEKGGTYKAILTVNDGKGSRCSTSSSMVNVMVNASPTACAVNPKTACVGEKVSFDACCSKPGPCCLKYIWDFGDGTILEAACCKVTHAFAKGGTYTVRLTVDDKKGTPCSTDSTTTTIKINTPPVAKVGADLACCQGMESTFDGSASSDADGDMLKYMWDFGDGSTAEGVKVTHAYAKGGTYKVTLKVDDGSGTTCNSSVASMQVAVKGAPVPKIKCK